MTDKTYSAKYADALEANASSIWASHIDVVGQIKDIEEQIKLKKVDIDNLVVQLNILVQNKEALRQKLSDQLKTIETLQAASEELRNG